MNLKILILRNVPYSKDFSFKRVVFLENSKNKYNFKNKNVSEIWAPIACVVMTYIIKLSAI